ncbi:MAG: type IV toxin-antitoxin system AbiEi family antitoxin domain-containing protein [Armatimonadota bacterium]
MTTLAEKRRQLFELAATQGGYFTAAQARALGYSSRSLVHHGRAGHFERVSRGFYRLAELPALPHEDVIAAWVKARGDRAVVSHETALALYELAPIRPRRIHLTVSRAHRPHSDRPQLPAVQIHTATAAVPP